MVIPPVRTTSSDQALGNATAVWFSGPRTVELVKEAVYPPDDLEVTVQAIASLVSRGTEMLAFRGELPRGMPLGLETAAGSSSFPMKYGYQVVGRVIQAGKQSPIEAGDLVFARHPHQTLFTVSTERGYVRKLARDINIADALFINLTDVALACLHDVPVRHGDVVVVFGLGVVGTIAAILAQQTAGIVLAVDPLKGRLAAASKLGVENVLTPEEVEAAVEDLTGGRGADIVIEASGNPNALQQCMAVCGREGTIAVVSFYGARSVHLSFNERFHLLRQRIVSSQVGGLGSGLEPRWDRARRFEVAAELATRFSVGRLLSHEAEIAEAPQAYKTLDQDPSDIIALAITYGGTRLRGGSASV